MMTKGTNILYADSFSYGSSTSLIIVFCHNSSTQHVAIIAFSIIENAQEALT